MYRRDFYIIALFMILGLYLVLDEHSANAVLTTKAFVNGTMSNQSNHPVSLKFEFTNSTQVFSQMTSPVNGSFSFNINEGKYLWKLSTNTQQPQMPRFFEVEKHINLRSNILQNLIPITFAITGKITDQNNVPLSGATIDTGVCNINIGNFIGSEEDVQTTNSSGYYSVNLLPSTCNAIKITTLSGKTFFPNSGRILQINGNMSNDIKLSNIVNINGKLTDSMNNPISSTVQFVGSDFVESTTTNSTNGKYSIDIPPNSNYVIKFSQNINLSTLPRFYDVEKQMSLLNNQTIDIKANTTSVSGTSKFMSSTIDVRNSLDYNGFNGFSEDRVTTDSNGNFNATLLQSNITTVIVQNFNTLETQYCAKTGNHVLCT